MKQMYLQPSDLPTRIPIFPLRGVILLPRTHLPLNIFEPRYLEMIDQALASSDRIIGVAQPGESDDDGEAQSDDAVRPRSVGGAGRITSFSETDDGRYVISLTGIARFELASEVTTTRQFRTFDVSFTPFANDLEAGRGEDEVDRDRLLRVLSDYLKANNLHADWKAIRRSSNEFLVNTLSMISPYESEEKQALLEAGDLKTRSEVLIALAEMDLASSDDGSAPTLQ